MSTPKDKDRPEAARDTASGKQGEGANERDAGSGGTRSKAGSDYGDWAPERSREPLMGDYYTGGGNIDRLAEEPGSPGSQSHEQPAEPSSQAQEPEVSGTKPGDDDQDTAAQANRNKSFDTTHVHAGTTPRKI